VVCCRPGRADRAAVQRRRRAERGRGPGLIAQHSGVVAVKSNRVPHVPPPFLGLTWGAPPRLHAPVRTALHARSTGCMRSCESSASSSACPAGIAHTSISQRYFPGHARRPAGRALLHRDQHDRSTTNGSSRVNSPKHDDAACAEAVETAGAGRG
jgi:hypothetical protein